MHADKNSSPDATVTFQELNTAYQNLTSRLNKGDNEGDNVSDSSHSTTALPNVSLYTRETHSHWQSISSISCSLCSWRSVQHIIMLTLLIEVQTAFSTASTTRVTTMSSTMGHYPWPSTPPSPVCMCKVPHTYSGWTNTFLWYTNGPRLSYQKTSAHGEAWCVAEELGLGKPTRGNETDGAVTDCWHPYVLHCLLVQQCQWQACRCVLGLFSTTW